MAGWNLTEGKLNTNKVSDDKYWSLFNYVFSDSSRKRNTYKFGLIKSILDSVFGAETQEDLAYISYEVLFEKFAINYWNLIVKYNLKQMRKDGKSELSKIEQIFYNKLKAEPLAEALEFDGLSEKSQKEIVSLVMKSCKQYVLGALYEDTEGYLYAFQLSGNGIYISKDAHEFMMRYKAELERLNYFAWAKFLEQINDDSVLCRLLDKLELSTPSRNDLSLFRRILEQEFEENTCFYCGKKLKSIVHVDHFIPWSFVKEDVLWNFVLSCPECNTRKNNRIPGCEFLHKIKTRNHNLCQQEIGLKIETAFGKYHEDRLNNLWEYAKLSGLKIWE